MALPEDQIRQLFPHGAVELKGRWLPAGPESEDVRTLKQLLKDKEKRREKPRFPARNPSQNIRYDKRKRRWVPGEPRPDEDRGYTDTPDRALDWEPGMGALDGVDDETLKRFSQEARVRFLSERGEQVIDWQAKVIANKIAKLQREAARLGLDLGPMFNQMLKEARQEIIRQRGKVAA